MKNITKKQMTTLVVLIIILILVIAVQYFYRPVLEEKNELSGRIEKMSTIYEDMKMTASIYNIDVITYKDEKELFDKKREEFLPYMTTSEQDNMLTKILVASDFDILSSVPSDEVLDTVLLECSLLTDSKESMDSKKDSDKNKTVLMSTEEALAMCPSGGEIVSSEESIMVLKYRTGEVSRDISYHVKGTYESIVDFVNKICSEKSMAITDINFSSGDIRNKQSEILEIVTAATETLSEQSETENTDAVFVENPEETISVSVTESDVTETSEVKIVENGIYDVSLTIRVYMYDRSFNWGTDDSKDE